MKQPTRTNSKLDSKSFGSRAKELVSISVFTIIAALVCILLMDILVFPLTMFAVGDVPSYNRLINLAFIVLGGGVVIYAITSTVRSLKRDNHTTGFILLYMIRRPMYYLGLFLFFIALCGLIITVIYLLFSMNYYYMHRLGGGM